MPKTDPRTGTVFSGTDDGKKWRIHVAPGDCSLQVGPYCQPDGHEQGNLENQDVLSLGYGELTADNSTLYWIHPRADVARADVQLSDGEHLTLTPALIGTIRVALFELPRRVGITRIGAYGSGGQEIAYTIPYLGADNVAIATDTWYRPDQQPTQAVLSRLITGPVNGAAAGSANSAGGTVQVDIGPWGICYTVRQRILATTDTRCRPLPAVGAAPGDQPTGFTDEVPQNPLSWIALGGLAPDNVDHVDFAVGGSTYRVKAVHLGGHTFAVCFVDTDTVKGLDRAIRGRTLYDASDKVISYDPAPAK